MTNRPDTDNFMDSILSSLDPKPNEKIDTTSPQPQNLENIRQSLRSIHSQLSDVLHKLDYATGYRSGTMASSVDTLQTDATEKIIEGMFNGEKFVGPDGHEYHVPPNYASKSKLVIGDHMKLTITASGSFIYKQIGPVERKRIVGALSYDTEHNKWSVDTEGRYYKVLTASISFYKGKPGDEAVILVPQSGESDWAAVDNIISK